MVNKQGVPRTCGDEPAYYTANEGNRVRSPHMRG